VLPGTASVGYGPTGNSLESLGLPLVDPAARLQPVPLPAGLDVDGTDAAPPSPQAEAALPHESAMAMAEARATVYGPPGPASVLEWRVLCVQEEEIDTWRRARDAEPQRKILSVRS
jgi:hypothetical protein